jgi:electron transport complex protein RnfE
LVRAVRENPLILLILGLCPALAVSIRLIDGLWICLGVTVVLVASSAAISFIGRAVSGRAPRVVSLLIVAAFASLFDLAMRALAPGPRAALGVYLPIIAVNCLVLRRTELAATEGSVRISLMRAAGSAAGFTLVVVLSSLIREALGAGTLSLFPIGRFSGTIILAPLQPAPALVAVTAAGGLLIVGYMAAASQWLEQRRASARDAGRALRGGET